MPSQFGKLFVIATPIGNLEDITLRAIRVLKEVDFIACEDTRHTRIVLDKYSINTPTIIYYETTREKADKKGQKIIDLLSEGKDIALVTDAGTPGISDPGQFLISKVIARNIEVIPIPGPSAFVAALSISGFNDPAVHFVPFLPKKKGRQTMLNFLKNLEATIVFYESPQRIGKTLSDLSSFFEVERSIVICRELTKIFEEAYRGTIAEALEKFSGESLKGEFVIVLKGYNGKKHKNQD